MTSRAGAGEASHSDALPGCVVFDAVLAHHGFCCWDCSTLVELDSGFCNGSDSWFKSTSARGMNFIALNMRVAQLLNNPSVAPKSA